MRLVDAKDRGPRKTEWRTPPRVVKAIEKHFNVKFTLDPCSAPDNHLGLETFYTAQDDGLSKPWSGCAWVNPPYDHKWVWVRKGYVESRKGVDVWLLLEVCTDTEEFHRWARLGEVFFLKGRIGFLGDDMKKIGNGFRGSMLMHFAKRLGVRLELLDLEL